MKIAWGMLFMLWIVAVVAGELNYRSAKEANRLLQEETDALKVTKWQLRQELKYRNDVVLPACITHTGNRRRCERIFAPKVADLVRLGLPIGGGE